MKKQLIFIITGLLVLALSIFGFVYWFNSMTNVEEKKYTAEELSNNLIGIELVRINTEQIDTFSFSVIKEFDDDTQQGIINELCGFTFHRIMAPHSVRYEYALVLKYPESNLFFTVGYNIVMRNNNGEEIDDDRNFRAASHSGLKQLIDKYLNE